MLSDCDEIEKVFASVLSMFFFNFMAHDTSACQRRNVRQVDSTLINHGEVNDRTQSAIIK